MRATIVLTLACTIAVLPRSAAAQAIPGTDPKDVAKTEEQLARCLGVDVELYRDWANPTRGENRQPTKAERGRQNAAAKILQKLPKGKMTECNQQVGSAGAAAMLGQVQQMMSQYQQTMGAAGGMTEAPGKQVAISDDLAGDLTAGRTVVRDIDWTAGQAGVSDAAAAGFADAMTKLGAALALAGGAYHIDFYLDQRYEESAARYVAERRFTAVRDALQGGAGTAKLDLSLGSVQRDANPRLEIVRAK